jgi:hypothetical protein
VADLKRYLKISFYYRHRLDISRLIKSDSFLLFPIPRDTSTGCRGTTLEDCNSVKTLSDDMIIKSLVSPQRIKRLRHLSHIPGAICRHRSV